MTESKVYTAIGLMSGTSLDGVDCALVETDGRDHVKPLAFLGVPYADAERGAIRAAFGQKDRGADIVRAAEAIVTDRHIAAVRELLARTGAKPDLIGFHGQTVYHAPKDGITIQIGDGARMAQELGIDVVDDFRSNDVRQGGEGAPLAPLYHAARIKSAKIAQPAVILNIGGVANVTYIDGESVIAFDTGPGNALMDDWTKRRTGRPYDEGGSLALSGAMRDDLVQTWLAHDYFKRTPPKSMDRDQWDIAGLGRLGSQLETLTAEDGAATFLQFTAEAIVKSGVFMPQVPKAWYACGGGRHNTALMAYLKKRLNEAGMGELKSVDVLGWDGDATEAECFAYLAVRSLQGMPVSLPATTGVPEPATGGVLHKAGRLSC